MGLLNNFPLVVFEGPVMMQCMKPGSYIHRNLTSVMAACSMSASLSHSLLVSQPVCHSVVLRSSIPLHLHLHPHFPSFPSFFLLPSLPPLHESPSILLRLDVNFELMRAKVAAHERRSVSDTGARKITRHFKSMPIFGRQGRKGRKE